MKHQFFPHALSSEIRIKISVFCMLVAACNI
jgi:hypothetical protein